MKIYVSTYVVDLSAYIEGIIIQMILFRKKKKKQKKIKRKKE